MNPFCNRVAVVLLSVSCSFGAEKPPATQRTADAIWAELESLQRPPFDESRSGDEAYVQAYGQQVRQMIRRQAELELELYQTDPNHAQAEQRMLVRWTTLMTLGEDSQSIIAEIEQFLRNRPNSPLASDARLRRAWFAQRAAGDDAHRLVGAAEAFIRASPRDERGGDLLLQAASAIKDPDKRNELYRRIMLEFPGSRAGLLAGGRLRQQQQIGMTFDLGFFDAMTGQWIHTSQLKGKVIVIDFWATWCPPCVADIPHLKELYAKYKDQGLEIIGVSLDGPRLRTDLETLKKFVKDNGVAWPQYYQGDGFDSAFSRSWGINGIPAVFVVDPEGKLHSTDARDKLDELIPQLLRKRE